MGLTDLVDRAQRRHPLLGYPLGVAYKFVDDQGGYLAALITYYAFVSLFPLLLVLSTVLGIVLAGHPSLQERVLDSALSQFPVIGPQLGEPKALGGGSTGLVIGVAGALYGALGVAQAVQNAMNTAWSVPRNERPNPFQGRARGVLLLLVVGLALVATTVASALAAGAGGYFAGTGRVLLDVFSVVVAAGAFLFAFRVGTARHVTVRQVVPGAVVAAIAWQLLQSFGAYFVGEVVRRSSAVNGVFALVLGLLAFLYLAAVTVVVCVELNVVAVDKLYPRSLLTPFTDDVDLTSGDRRSYTGLAEAQRSKGFERVDVSFDEAAGSQAPSSQAPGRQAPSSQAPGGTAPR